MSNPLYRGPNGHPHTLGEFVGLVWSIRWSCARCNLTDMRKADMVTALKRHGPRLSDEPFHARDALPTHNVSKPSELKSFSRYASAIFSPLARCIDMWRIFPLVRSCAWSSNRRMLMSDMDIPDTVLGLG